MKTVSISGSARQNVGKKDARDLRLQGRIPCVVYGGEEQIMFTAAEKDLIQLFNKPEVCFVDLDIDGKKIKAVPQDSQFHKVTDALLHVDFLELRDDRPIRMAVPLLTTGNAAGVLKGGKLVKRMRRLRLRALPANMPENITVDVTNLDIAQEVKVKDLCSDKYQIMEDMTAAVVLVKSTRNAQAAAAAAPAE
ncbi:MAG: 50S ribosomal protein L25 [Bacteroidetes bacterium]|uniref:Large ribosomal subunit protein bL25 n=2 Tax=Candidatus Pullibacteroides excrementavium TaxID=2840905 RepID=A0A9D9H0J2_9BACT|nr:50S ribosomal protein L25 [Candidatus Pullibacteroides excrementavium]